jgi:hypothetical protein
MKLFKWITGRQQGTEYKKFCFLYFKFLNFGADAYILKYEPHTILKPHRDQIDGKHYRLNIEFCGEGKFESESVIFNLFDRVYFFRPDINTHNVTNYDKTRYVLSFGFAIFNKNI